MRTYKQKEDMANAFKVRRGNKKRDAITEVIECDLTEEDIEEVFHNPRDPWVEQAALRAREWLDGEITDEELLDNN